MTAVAGGRWRRPEATVVGWWPVSLISDFLVTVLNPKNVLIKLVNDFDYYRVFAHRSYFINNCYMRLIKWSPSFDVDIKSPIILIWVSFTNLRPHLFSPWILHGLRSIFCHPLKIDHATSTGSKPLVAHVIVELDVSKHFPDKVCVGPDNLVCGYGDFLSYCSHCKSLGHSKLECHILHPHLVTRNNVGIEPVNNGNKLPLIVNLVETVSSDPRPTVGQGLSVVTSTDVLRDPSEQVADGIDGSLTVALPLVDKVVASDALSCGINEDVTEVCVQNNCLLNVAASPLVPLDSNVDVNDGETALPEESTPLPGDRACVSPLVSELVLVVQGEIGAVENLHVGVPCDALALKGVEVSIGSPHDGTVLGDAVSPSVNLAKSTVVVDIPISVVSNAELKTHMALSVSNSSLDHSDWLN
ncbi:hypothetical protein IEQ34_013043 [Dendrobium chrysotoxum]|uniref:DUF4283 domain-containing protein n=1 Tax=Dendrobium chrysotoxum TaxID=161865 RepID=A0AAV7GQC0_DENCH|nr:hypothetical protein IEQ34_013043 [Dendrobium chrysotoxum]